MKKENVVKEYIVSYNGIHLLMHLIRKGDYLIPTAVKVVNNEQANQKEIYFMNITKNQRTQNEDKNKMEMQLRE
jgi:hypothetical protein